MLQVFGCRAFKVALLFMAHLLNTSFVRVSEEEQQDKNRLPPAVGLSSHDAPLPSGETPIGWTA